MMTRDKAQKRAIRARMDKTGERYTTARHHMLDLHRTASAEREPDGAAVAEVSPPEEPGINGDRSGSDSWVAAPGMSDDAILRGTGKTWEEWIALLDAWGGSDHSHPEIARHVHETYGVGGWWAQSVTVGYERARGMRAVHERPDGFSMNVSKTISVPVERLFTAFVEPDQRERWLEAVSLRNRTSQPNRSARFDVLPGETRLAITFVAKGAEKSAAQLQMERLTDAADVARWKALWKEQLALLAAYLSEESARR
jgi:hypothetical protein